MNNIILASQSIGRKALFEGQFNRFEIQVSDIDESRIDTSDPAKLTEELAFLKAEAVSAVYPSDFVIGCDTVVACEGNILGKPRDIGHAKEMLRYLSGKEQSVFSGYAVFHQTKNLKVSGYAETLLTFKKLSEPFIEEYVKTHPVTRFAGGYGIQVNDEFIDIIRGTFDTIVGAPMDEIVRVLLENGMPKNLLK